MTNRTGLYIMVFIILVCVCENALNSEKIDALQTQVNEIHAEVCHEN